MAKNDILTAIRDRTEYTIVLDAVTGLKTSFSGEEVAKLLEIYRDNAKNNFGFADETLVKAVLAMDVPGANLLGKADAEALDDLCELCKDWAQNPEKAAAVAACALSGDVSEPLALALARAALDVYAAQDNVAQYREEITALADLLKGADEAAFADASVFLIRVRERARVR